MNLIIPKGGCSFIGPISVMLDDSYFSMKSMNVQLLKIRSFLISWLILLSKICTTFCLVLWAWETLNHWTVQPNNDNSTLDSANRSQSNIILQSKIRSILHVIWYNSWMFIPFNYWTRRSLQYFTVQLLNRSMTELVTCSTTDCSMVFRFTSSFHDENFDLVKDSIDWFDSVDQGDRKLTYHRERL